MARSRSRGASRFVAKEMRHRGRHRSRKQAIAIGLNRARRAGKRVPGRRSRAKK